jgi:hypothetical protein
LHDVKIEKPNPQYAVLLQEQLGGGNGELKAALQYMSQSFRIKDPEIMVLQKTQNYILIFLLQDQNIKILILRQFRLKILEEVNKKPCLIKLSKVFYYINVLIA